MRQPWPTDKDIEREMLFAAWMWGAIGVASLGGTVFCLYLLAVRLVGK